MNIPPLQGAARSIVAQTISSHITQPSVPRPWPGHEPRCCFFSGLPHIAHGPGAAKVYATHHPFCTDTSARAAPRPSHKKETSAPWPPPAENTLRPPPPPEPLPMSPPRADSTRRLRPAGPHAPTLLLPIVRLPPFQKQPTPQKRAQRPRNPRIRPNPAPV